MDLKKWLFEAFCGAIGGAIAGPIFGFLLLLLWNGIEKWLSIYPRFEPSDATVMFCCSAIAGAIVRAGTVAQARGGEFD